MFDIKHNRVLQGLILVIMAYLVYVLRDVIIVVFLAFLFTAVLRPVTTWLERHKVPTFFAVLLPLLAVLALLVGIGYFIIPTFVDQAKQFADKLPNYYHSLTHSSLFRSNHIDINSVANSLKGHVNSLTNAAVSVGSTVAKIGTGVLSIIVMALYWTGNYERIKESLVSFFPAKRRQRVNDIWRRVEVKFAHWALAQLLLSVVIGLSTWIGTTLIGVPFSGSLGIIAGLLEFIPTLGAIVAAIPGILLALSVNVQTAIITLLLYLFIHQVENHFVVPFLFGKTVRLHPIVIITSLLTGAVLLGILGVLIAVPAALFISAIVESYRDEDFNAQEDKPKALRLIKEKIGKVNKVKA